MNKQITKKLMHEVSENKRALQRKKGTNPMLYRQMPVVAALDELDQFHALSRLRYLYAMIHPEEAVTQGMQVKLYSDLPLPTNSAGIRETFYVTPSNHGTIAIAWNPNFFSSPIAEKRLMAQVGNDHINSNTRYSHLFVNTSAAALTGTQPNEGHWTALQSYNPEINIQQYRIVSAMLRVKYVGNLMNQAGMLYSCATTIDMPPLKMIQQDRGSDTIWPDPMESVEITSAMSSKPNTPAGSNTYYLVPEDRTGVNRSYAPLCRFSDFNLVKNGMWNYSHNITEQGGGVECLFVPLDAHDTTFREMGMYYNSGPSQAKAAEINLAAADSCGAVYCVMDDNSLGNPLKYVVVGQNLPHEANCIMIEVFYNFECIADPSVCPFLRAAPATVFSKDDQMQIASSVGKIAQNGALIRKASKGPTTFENFVRKAPGLIAKAKEWGKNIFDIVKLFI